MLSLLRLKEICFLRPVANSKVSVPAPLPTMPHWMAGSHIWTVRSEAGWFLLSLLAPAHPSPPTLIIP